MIWKKKSSIASTAVVPSSSGSQTYSTHHLPSQYLTSSSTSQSDLYQMNGNHSPTQLYTPAQPVNILLFQFQLFQRFFLSYLCFFSYVRILLLRLIKFIAMY